MGSTHLAKQGQSAAGLEVAGLLANTFTAQLTLMRQLGDEALSKKQDKNMLDIQLLRSNIDEVAAPNRHRQEKR